MINTNLEIVEDFFTLKEKESLKKSIIKLFLSLNLKFNKLIEGENIVSYFDEILIVSKDKDKIQSLFYYVEEGKEKEREEFHSKQIDKIITDFIFEYSYDSFLFIKDQKNAGFDYITRCVLKEKNVLVLLNNIEFSLDQLQRMYPKSWIDMNEINYHLDMFLRNSLVTSIEWFFYKQQKKDINVSFFLFL